MKQNEGFRPMVWRLAAWRPGLPRGRKVRASDVAVFCLLLVSAILLIAFLRVYHPQTIVQGLGLANIYLIVLLFAMFGGVSFLVAAYFYAALAVFISGGTSPWLLALIAATGLTIGDLFFYLIGLKGAVFTARYFSMPKHARKLDWLEARLERSEFWLIYLYASFAPLPKDLLSLALGLFNRRLRDIVPPLFLGNLTYNLLFAGLVLLRSVWAAG